MNWKNAILVAIILGACSNYNTEMNALLAKKKVLEAELLNSRKSAPAVTIDFDKPTPKDTTGNFAKELEENNLNFARVKKEDSLMKEISKVKYSIDSLSKLK